MRNRSITMFLSITVHCAAAKLSPSADRAFQGYVDQVEFRLDRQHTAKSTYLGVLDSSQRSEVERQLMAGELRIEPVNGDARPLDGALLHHWRGAAFVPNATATQMLALLRDFHHWSGQYAPDVAWSRTIANTGDTATVAVRFRKQVVITIVLDAEYRVESKLTASDRGYNISRSAHFWQVDDAGTAREHRRPEGHDDGFLWRLNSYWSFVNAGGQGKLPQGLEFECEAVSLTRDVPVGLGWLISPIVADLPRELLVSTLTATKNALSAMAAGEAN